WSTCSRAASPSPRPPARRTSPRCRSRGADPAPAVAARLADKVSAASRDWISTPPVTPPVHDVEAIALPPSRVTVAADAALPSVPLAPVVALDRVHRYEVALAVLVSGVLALLLASYPGVDAA